MPKARELRPFVERLITVAKRGLATGDSVKTMNARRLVSRDLADTAVVSKLFESIAPRFEKRPGGYTRLLKIGPRRGDSADMAQVELVGSEYNPNLEKDIAPGVRRARPASADVCAPLRTGCAARRPTAEGRCRE